MNNDENQRYSVVLDFNEQFITIAAAAADDDDKDDDVDDVNVRYGAERAADNVMSVADMQVLRHRGCRLSTFATDGRPDIPT